MCGYCSEGMLIGYCLPAELAKEGMMHGNVPVSYLHAVFPQESSDPIDYLSWHYKSGNFDLSLNTVYCRLLGWMCGAQDLTGEHINFIEVKNFLSWFRTQHFEKEYSPQKLQRGYEYIPKGKWSWAYSFNLVFAGESHTTDAESIITDCHEMLKNYVRWWINGPSNKFDQLDVFYTLLPGLFYSICMVAKHKKAKNILIEIASKNPGMVSFHAYELWLKRKALSLFVEQYGLEEAVSKIGIIEPKHIYYLYLTHTEARNNPDICLSQLQQYIDGGWETYLNPEEIMNIIKKDLNH